jgi:hypothetical protein
MRALKLLTCVCLVAGGLAVAAGAAVAKQSPAVDCNTHNYTLTQQYTPEELQHALATMPAQIKEYTPCYQVIQEELTRLTKTTTSTTGTGSGSGGSFLSGPLIAVVIVIVIVGGGAAYVASRRKSGGEDGGEDGDEPPPTAET